METTQIRYKDGHMIEKKQNRKGENEEGTDGKEMKNLSFEFC